MRRRLLCVVRGEVQGVSFRDFIRATANDRRLVGTVRNLTDGTVEVLAEGEVPILKAFILALKTEYPYAKVTRIDEVWSEATGEFSDFKILFS